MAVDCFKRASMLGLKENSVLETIHVRQHSGYDEFEQISKLRVAGQSIP
jgi:hypothetical protein